MKHQWTLDSNGQPDLWFFSYGYHNGPYCERCLESWCINCTPAVLDADNCPGDE